MYAADSAKVVLSKTDFEIGEQIELSYTGTSGKDWIGIYPKDSIPGGGNPSIDWKYTSDIGQPDGEMFFKNELAVGAYDLVLLENDGYNILSMVAFNIVEGNKLPLKPEGVTYENTGGKGFAEGIVNIKPAIDESHVSDYVIYWGNDDGKLADYTPIVTLKKSGEPLQYKIPSNVIVPKEANCIMIYSKGGGKESLEYSKAEIPQSLLPDDYGIPLYKFQVITDTHITSTASHIHNKHFGEALKQIKELASDSVGIMHTGDLTDSGKESEYAEFKHIWDDNIEGLQPFYFAVGNHDLYTGTWNQASQRFTEFANTESVYYDTWIEDNHFIFLGSEKGGNEYITAELTDAQLSWLETTIAQKSSLGKPIFVFIHQPLKNTVAGSFENQGWYGVNQNQKLNNILSKYPQVVLFSGHTHWEFDSLNNMFDGENLTFSAFNSSSVGYLWTDKDTGKVGSQGNFVEVYEDKILVRGRDFTQSKWSSNAQFMVKLGTDSTDTSPDTTDSKSTPMKNNDTPPQTRDFSLLLLLIPLLAVVMFTVVRRKKKSA